MTYPKKKKKILDIGFGETSELYTLSQYHSDASIVGVDVFQKPMKSIVRELKDIPTISAMTGNINTLDFEDGYFDIIYLFNSLYFAHDLQTVLKQLFSMLTKKGVCIIALDITDVTDFLQSKQAQLYDKHQIQYQKINMQQLSKQLEQAGFKENMQYKSVCDREMLLVRKK